MGRGGEYGVLQQVFPIPGEGTARHHPGRSHRARAFVADGKDHVSFGERRRIAQGHGLDAERPVGAQESEAGVVVIPDNRCRDGVPVRGQDLGRLRLQNQVADGQHQAVGADDDAAALALGAKGARGAGIGADIGAHADHRPQHLGDGVGGGRLGGARHRRRARQQRGHAGRGQEVPRVRQPDGHGNHGGSLRPPRSRDWNQCKWAAGKGQEKEAVSALRASPRHKCRRRNFCSRKDSARPRAIFRPCPIPSSSPARRRFISSRCCSKHGKYVRMEE